MGLYRTETFDYMFWIFALVISKRYHIDIDVILQ